MAFCWWMQFAQVGEVVLMFKPHPQRATCSLGGYHLHKNDF